MATQNNPQRRSSKMDTIECPNCHERYSTTYRRCPFCKELTRTAAVRTATRSSAAASKASDTRNEEGRRPRSEEERRPRTRSTDSRGRRVARNTRGGGYGKPAYLNQIIFFAVTLALIIAACVVIGKIVGPLLNRDTEDEVETSTSTSTEVETTPDVLPEVVIPEVEEEPEVSSVIAITLSHSDVTLGSGEGFELIAKLTPSDADDTIVWTSDSSAASVSTSGFVTNTNTSSSPVVATVTASVGDISVQCIVRCKAVGVTSTTSTTSTGSGNAVVTGAASGLNIRSGPSTSDDVIASLTNGSVVTIISTPTSGWYEISFNSSDGTTQTGYASASYIQAN